MQYPDGAVFLLLASAHHLALFLLVLATVPQGSPARRILLFLTFNSDYFLQHAQIP